MEVSWIINYKYTRVYGSYSNIINQLKPRGSHIVDEDMYDDILSHQEVRRTKKITWSPTHLHHKVLIFMVVLTIVKSVFNQLEGPTLYALNA